ncbi:MAG: hypothetical protein ACRCTW_04925, partial [Lactococcus garvieae]
NCGAKRNKKARHAKMAGRQINGSNKQLNTFYLRPNRWRCAETLHVASGHACDDMYHIWCEYDKALQRYSLKCIYATLHTIRSRVYRK